MTDLTEQWKKGELPSGWYYVKIVDIVFIDFFEGKVWKNKKDEYIDEVLAPVPSYKGFMTLIRAYDEVVDENTKLKKECKTLAQKLIQVKPELKEWLEINYGEYLNGNKR